MSPKEELKKFWLNKEKFLYLHKLSKRNFKFSDVCLISALVKKPLPTEKMI